MVSDFLSSRLGKRTKYQSFFLNLVTLLQHRLFISILLISTVPTAFTEKNPELNPPKKMAYGYYTTATKIEINYPPNLFNEKIPFRSITPPSFDTKIPFKSITPSFDEKIPYKSITTFDKKIPSNKSNTQFDENIPFKSITPFDKNIPNNKNNTQFDANIPLKSIIPFNKKILSNKSNTQFDRNLPFKSITPINKTIPSNKNNTQFDEKIPFKSISNRYSKTYSKKNSKDLKKIIRSSSKKITPKAEVDRDSIRFFPSIIADKRETDSKRNGIECSSMPPENTRSAERVTNKKETSGGKIAERDTGSKNKNFADRNGAINDLKIIPYWYDPVAEKANDRYKPVKDESDKRYDGGREKEEIYSVPQHDQPGRQENGLLNRLYREFSSLRLELQANKQKLATMEKKLHDEMKDNQNLKREVEGRYEEIRNLMAERDELTAKNQKCQTNLTDHRSKNIRLTRDLNQSQKELTTVKTNLSTTLNEHRELKEEHDKQTNVVNMLHNRLLDCIQSQLSLHCEFEDERACGFVQDDYLDNLDWIRTSGTDHQQRQTSSRTGNGVKPKADKTCSNDKGHYMHVDVQANMVGRTARMRTPRIFGSEEQCVEFYYWMFGRLVGTLNVFSEVPDEGIVSPVWRIYGNQGEMWIKAKFNIPKNVASAGYRMVFEAILDRGQYGDIRLDNFKVVDGHCDRPITKSTLPITASSILMNELVDQN